MSCALFAVAVVFIMDITAEKKPFVNCRDGAARSKKQNSGVRRKPVPVDELPASDS